MQIKVCEDAGDRLRQNIEVHDRISGDYDAQHGEIFNEVEQKRLRAALLRAHSCSRSGSRPGRALDFGCGSGNLTRHLLDLGMDVVASDVSERFLSLVQARFGTARLSIHRLNGTNLGEFGPETCDLVAAYSVLHHVPDYLAAIREMGRVCKRGGIVYLDHEPPGHFWDRDPAYQRFISEVSRFDWQKFFVWRNYVGKVRRIFNPKFANEGDIHVWQDDHVEWDLIENELCAAGFELAFKEDYLLFRRGYDRDVYERHKDGFTDMRVTAFRKL